MSVKLLKTMPNLLLLTSDNFVERLLSRWSNSRYRLFAISNFVLITAYINLTLIVVLLFVGCLMKLLLYNRLYST